MPTYSTTGGSFLISRLPGQPTTSANLTGVAFGIDKFGIPIFTFKSTGPMPGIPYVDIGQLKAGNATADRALLTYQEGPLGQPAVLNIPQPVGTGATRGVPCGLTGPGFDQVYYIRCTQTPPT